MSSDSHIPLDLIIEIVGYLHDDITSLKNASTASSTFRDPCQAILFSTLTLPRHTAACNIKLDSDRYFQCSCGIDHDQELEPLLDIFKQNPRLPWSVTTLTLQFAPGSWTAFNFKPRSGAYTKLFEVLNLLHHDRIRTLSVLFPPHTCWNIISITLASTIARFCQSEYLTSLRLFCAPPELIAFSRGGLKSLAVCGTDHIEQFISLSQFNFHSPDSSPDIRSNSTVIGPPPSFDNVAVEEKLSCLSNLHVALSPCWKAQYSTLLDMCAPLLQSLSISFEPRAEEPLFPDLSSLKDIRNLTFYAHPHWSQYSTMFMGGRAIERVIYMLNSLPPENKLQHLFIIWHLRDDDEASNSQDHDYLLSNCTRFTQVIADKTRFESLRSVTLKQTFDERIWQHEEATRDPLRSSGVEVSVIRFKYNKTSGDVFTYYPQWS